MLLLDNIKRASLVPCAGQGEATTASPTDDWQDVVINLGPELLSLDVKYWVRSSFSSHRKRLQSKGNEQQG